jgi:hypothetical protein
MGFTVASGWSLLLDGQSVNAGLRHAFDLAWLAALFFPPGLWAQSVRALLATAAFALGSLLILPPALGLVPTPSVQLLAAMTGILAGWVSSSGFVLVSRQAGLDGGA